MQYKKVIPANSTYASKGNKKKPPSTINRHPPQPIKICQPIIIKTLAVIALSHTINSRQQKSNNDMLFFISI